jgi:hypothetical protein
MNDFSLQHSCVEVSHVAFPSRTAPHLAKVYESRNMHAGLFGVNGDYISIIMFLVLEYHWGLQVSVVGGRLSVVGYLLSVNEPARYPFI